MGDWKDERSKIARAASAVGRRTDKFPYLWIQKVFVSLGAKRFSYLWVPKGFRIFRDVISRRPRRTGWTEDDSTSL
jgi:hypothetical protein